MVLEHLFPENWLERRWLYAFLIALIYSIVSIIVARLLFAANSGLASVVFASLLILPYLQKLFENEERAELREKGRFRYRRFLVDNLPAIKVYASLFFGIYCAYMLASFLMPAVGLDPGIVFREQLSPELGLRGHAFNSGLFQGIFLNNWWVLLACFLLAIITGDGAIFFITWNASTWGAIFGYRALAAGVNAFDPVTNLLLIFAITLPHVILEGGAYILAAIAGGVISDDVITESGEVPRFLGGLLIAILGYVLLAFFFALLIESLWVRGILHIITILLFLLLLGYSFPNKDHRRVFLSNHRLFCVAILCFLLGAFVETLVLGSSSLLAKIYAAALL